MTLAEKNFAARYIIKPAKRVNLDGVTARGINTSKIANLSTLRAFVKAFLQHSQFLVCDSHRSTSCTMVLSHFNSEPGLGPKTLGRGVAASFAMSSNSEGGLPWCRCGRHELSALKNDDLRERSGWLLNAKRRTRTELAARCPACSFALLESETAELEQRVAAARRALGTAAGGGARPRPAHPRSALA